MSWISNRRRTRNQKGFSLLEVMIVVGIMGIVGLGLASLLAQLAKSQRAANVKALLTSQKMHIEQIVKDQNAWDKTINATTDGDNTEFACMRTGSVSNCTPGVISNIALYEAGSPDSTFLNRRVATNGYTTRGEKCPFGGITATFPSDGCPIRWNFTVTLSCPSGAATCLGPSIRFQARPEIPADQQESLGLSINENNYAVDITRGVATRFDPILIEEQITGSTGAGDCPGGNIPPTTSGVYGSANRRFNVATRDPAGNVLQVTTGSIRFQTGSYQCRITAPAFKVGNHYLEFMASTSGTPLATSAPAASPLRYSVPTNAVLEVSFNVPATTVVYTVRHRCQFSGYASPLYPGETNNSQTRLGYSSGSGGYGGTVTYATMSCYRNG